MEPVDIPQLEGQTPLPEGPQQEPQPVPVPEPQPQPSPYRLRYRGEEREVPREPIDALAPALGTTPEGIINYLQRAREADRISRRNSQLEAELDELRQSRAAQYQERMGGGQAPPPSAAPPYQPPYAPPQQYAQDDPVALLQALRAEQGQLIREQREFIDASRRDQAAREEATQQFQQTQQAMQIAAQAERFLAEANKGRKEAIELDDFMGEVELSGGSNRYVPLEQAFQRALTWMTRDELVSHTQSELMSQLRNPQAKVVIPSAPSAAPAAKPANPLDGMTWGQALDLGAIPEARR